jgi:serine/threonine protein phosphatase PrpC
MQTIHKRGSSTKKIEYLPEPSVEGGKVFQSLNPREHSGVLSGAVLSPPTTKTLGGSSQDLEAQGLREADPEQHSIARGLRSARSALVVVQETEKNAHVASCQYPGRKDQDRYAVQLSSDITRFPHYVGLFDGHGTSVFAADLCATSMLSTIVEKHAAGRTDYDPLPTDDSLVEAFTNLHDQVLDQVKRHPRSGTTAVALFIGRSKTDGDTHCTVKAAWAGDTRCIMVTYIDGSSMGSVSALTEDHSLSSNPKEVERINNADHTPRAGLLESPGWAIEEQMALERGVRARASSYVGRREINGREAGPLVVFAHSGGVSLQVSRSIGDALAARSVLPHPEITTTKIPLDARVRFIVGTDGLWDVYSSEGAAKLVMDVADTSMAARKLALAARSKRTQTGKTVDDISVIVLDLNPKLTGKGGGNGISTGVAGGKGTEKCILM